jgi:5-methylcytosine-specific restriction endonuclease McrA
MARQLVFNRDKGFCAHCGFDVAALDDAVKELMPRRRDQWDPVRWSETYPDFLRQDGLRLSRSHWEAHHKHAVIEGGGECGLDGYETLCWRCHPVETGQLRRRLNQQKAELQSLPLFAEAQP